MAKKKEEDKEDSVLGWVLILGALWFGYDSISGGGPNTITTATVDGKQYEITPKNGAFDLGSEKQQYMRKFINKTIESIPDDATSIVKKKIWINASHELCNSNQFNAFGLMENWVGYVDTVLMRDDGSIQFEVQIDETDNEVQQMRIAKRFEDVALNLKDNDIVRISGTFGRGKLSENECLAGYVFSDSNPELYNEGFAFKFTNIEKIPTRTVEVE